MKNCAKTSTFLGKKTQSFMEEFLTKKLQCNINNLPREFFKLFCGFCYSKSSKKLVFFLQFLFRFFWQKNGSPNHVIFMTACREDRILKSAETDGRDISELPIGVYRNNVALVSQDPVSGASRPET